MALLLVWNLYKHVNLVGGIKNHKRSSKFQCGLKNYLRFLKTLCSSLHFYGSLCYVLCEI